jgi:hypothetical protein
MVFMLARGNKRRESERCRCGKRKEERKKERKKEWTLAFQADSSGGLRVARLKSSRKARFFCRRIGRVVGGKKVKRGKEESQG